MPTSSSTPTARDSEYIFPNDRIFQPSGTRRRGASPKQIEALNAGKAIFVEDMKRKDGEVFSAFVKLDEASGRPAYTRYNPDSPGGSKGKIYIPKELKRGQADTGGRKRS